MTIEVIPLAEAHARMKAQAVSSQKHYAFKCPICGTVQSMMSLVKAGAKPDTAHEYIAFSCEGRFSGAGPTASEKDRSAKAKARRQLRGCDWTLGGLFQLHKLEISYPDGKQRPSFEIVSGEEARALETEMSRAPALEAETSP